MTKSSKVPMENSIFDLNVQVFAFSESFFRSSVADPPFTTGKLSEMEDRLMKRLSERWPQIRTCLEQMETFKRLSVVHVLMHTRNQKNLLAVAIWIVGWGCHLFLMDYDFKRISGPYIEKLPMQSEFQLLYWQDKEQNPATLNPRVSTTLSNNSSRSSKRLFFDVWSITRTTIYRACI